jgi:opacity protein-like surface antigen
MKKLLLIMVVAVTALPGLQAQPVMLGGGLTFSSGYHFHNLSSDGSRSSNLGITFKHAHKINVPLEFSPTFTFFRPRVYKDATTKEIVTTMMIDIDLHYKFNALDRFEFYGLAGPDLIVAWNKTTVTFATNGSTTTREKDGGLGLNIGAGSYMKLSNQFDLYLEAKYVISKYDQFVVNAGILINIDWLKKHENTGIN